MSAYVCWAIIRNNNAFLKKRRNIGKAFSMEPGNLPKLNSFRYNGLVHKKTIDITEALDRKGVIVKYKRCKAQNKPRKSIVIRTIKADPRKSLVQQKRTMKATRCRPDLTKISQRKISALLRSQKAVPVKKQKAKKTE